MGMTGISRSQVSSICRGIDERVQAFLQRPLEGEWPYLWLDATYVKVRKNGWVVSVAVIIACAVKCCRVHFMRNMLSRVSRASQSVVRAALQQVFVQTDEKSAHAT